MPAVYLVLLALAIGLNRKDGRMLTLIAVVGVSVFIPAPREWPNFYIFCISAEIIVALLALRLKAAASAPVILLCVALVIAHIMGYYKDGYPNLSPYRVIIPCLETLEILCCILASAPISSILRNRESP